MTVKQLRDKLAAFPDNMSVFMTKSIDEFSHGSVESVTQEEIKLREDPNGKVMGTETVVVIDEQ